MEQKQTTGDHFSIVMRVLVSCFLSIQKIALKIHTYYVKVEAGKAVGYNLVE